jgi:signal transduction histidine kinase
MKICVILFCFGLLPAAMVAQQKGNEGYVSQATEKEDTAYINALTKKSVECYLYSPGSSRAMAEKALILSKKLDYTRGEGDSYAAIGYTYWAQSSKSLSLYNLANAVEYLKAAKDYAELSMCYRMMARNYMEMNNFSLATQYLQEAEKNAVLSKNNNRIELVYNESSLLDFLQGNYAKALSTAKTAMLLAIKNNDTLLKGIIYSRQATILSKTGDTRLSKSYFDSAFVWAKLAGNNRLRAYLFINNAEDYLAAGKTDSAIAVVKLALAVADSLGNTDIKLNAAFLQVKILRQAGDEKHELEARRIYDSLQNNIRNTEAEKNFLLLQQFVALNKKLNSLQEDDRLNSLRRDRISFQHFIILALIISVAVLTAGFFTIFYLYSEKKGLVKQLAARNNEMTAQKSIIEEQSRNLSELNDLKTKLFAVIGHDLRTPISSLRSVMGLFQQHDLTEEQAAALLKRMIPALDGADLTLSNLLNWSVKQMTGLKVNKTNVLVAPVAGEIQKIFAFALEQKNITLTVIVDAGARAFCDEHHLKIVLRNLVSNAIKFTPAGGNITISEKMSGEKIVFCVKDTGQGISEEDLPKLFMSTVHFTTRGTNGEKGTGLGLLLCRELLELNNGTITVESAPGLGSTFCIALLQKES